ncbi:MAG: sporulation protein YunB [Clostridia bacterium]|nr:sporulation protein YunB [Clostridia bacterium]
MKKKFGTMKFGRPYRTYIRPARKKRISRWAVALLIATSVTYCICSALVRVYPLIEDVSQKMLEANATNIINKTVLTSLNGDMYNKLMDISYNDDGQITSITADTAAINKFKSNLAVDILNDIEQFGSKGFTIPLGNLTDIILLSGIGPKIPFCIVPYGNVKVDFRSQFTDAGINQTRHEIYIDITADMRAISAVARIKGTVTTSVMAAQTIIVGNTPQFFAER